jgi:hypothetical protein
MNNPIQIRETKSLSVTIVTDNYYDALRSNPAIGR